MRVAAATLRGPKLDALSEVLREIDAGGAWEIAPFAVPSGVRETPLSSDEIRRGARGRVEWLLRDLPGFDLYIGMEGGVASAGPEVWLENWAYASDGRRGYFGSGGSVPLPAAIAEQVIAHGRSLSDVIDELAGRGDIRSQEGTWGVLTRHLITRRHAFRDALVNALAPFLLSAPLYRER
jgi:inosine/xanthosine triphosphatase